MRCWLAYRWVAIAFGDALVVALCLLLLPPLLGAGCDRSPAPAPPSAAAPVDPADATARAQDGAEPPTTQSPNASASTTALRLSYFPLVVDAPRGWQIKSFVNGDVVFLQGPTPSGEDVQIQLSHRPRVSADQLIIRQNATTREAAEPSQSLKLSEARTAGVLTILEQQSLGKQKVSLTDAHGNALPDTLNYKWTVHVFVPRDNDYENYELNFVGLTADQYEKDGRFLRQIVNSLRYLEDAGAAASTSKASAGEHRSP